MLQENKLMKRMKKMTRQTVQKKVAVGLVLEIAQSLEEKQQELADQADR